MSYGHYRRYRALFYGALFFVLLWGMTSCSSPPPSDHTPCEADAGRCAPAGCTDASCLRGVCGDAGQCANARDCAGDDSRCLDGYVCAADGTCKVDACAGRTSQCARGVCDRLTGDCVDKATCASSSECLDGERCLGDRCTGVDALCGADGCPGNQICQYDEAARSAACAEASSCTTSLDCRPGRVCGGVHCVSAPVCEDDAFEPNEATNNATDFALMSHLHALHATLCAGDVDVYRVAVPSSQTTRRELRVDLSFPRREVGLGPIAMEVTTDAGDPVGTATSDDAGQLHLVEPLPNVAPDAYLLRIAAGDEAGELGIDYTLSARVQPKQADQTCQDATALQLDQPTLGDTSRSSATAFRSRCALGQTRISDVYAFDITEPSRVHASVESSDSSQFTVGIRSACQRLDTELSCARSQEVPQGVRAQTDDVVLSPGHYFALVQSPDSSNSGPYTLRVHAEAIGCDPAADSCSDLSTARQCDPASGQRTTRQCARGCTPGIGQCVPQSADTCEDAPLVTASGTYQVQRSSLTADYQVADDGCVPVVGGSNQTDGVDAAFRVALPPHSSLTASLAARFPRFASVYIVDDCLSPTDTCLAAGNADYVDAETARYVNEGDQPRSVFVIADSTPPTVGTATLTLDLEALVCESWQSRCHGDALQKCNDQRTGFETIDQCRWGCSNSSCNAPPGDQCVAAQPLVDGQTFSETFADYTNERTTDISRCNVELAADQLPKQGPDAFFSVDLNAGDMLTATLTTQAYASLFVFDDCAAGPSASCLRGTESGDSIEYLARQSGTYYIGVDAAAPNETAPFDVSVAVDASNAVCQPGGVSCDPANGDAVTCSDDGSTELARYSCPNGCVPHGCQTPTPPNDTCAAAMPISGGGTRLVDNLARFSDDFELDRTCNITSSDAPDAVYAVDMAADDVLVATAQTTRGWNPMLYVVTDCSDIQRTCAAGANGTGGRAHLEYHAQSAGTVFLVVDANYIHQDATYRLDVTVGPQQCQFGQTYCQSPSNLGYCTQVGLYQSYSCDGGCNQATCGTPRGDICADAIAVTDGQTVHGDWHGTNSLTLNPTVPGQCQYDGPRFYGPTSTSGADTFYRIDLQPHDLLTVDMRTAAPQAKVYFLDSCTGVDSCQPGGYASRALTSQYYSENGGAVWVMVDGAVPPNTLYTYDLTFQVRHAAACAPDQAFCSANDTVAICNADGTGVASTFTCPNGCARGGCQADASAADHCATAPDVGDGMLVYADPTDLSDAVSGLPESCDADRGSGRDLVYQVTLGVGEMLHAKSNARLDIITDCSDPAGSCIATDDPGLQRSLVGDEVYWKPPQPQTVRVVANVPAADHGVRLLVEKLPVQCSLGDRQCLASNDGFRSCTTYGRWKTQTCQTSCTQGRCDVPSGENCLDAIPLSAPQSLYGDLARNRDDVDPRSDACPGTHAFADAVYAVDLLAGDKLTATALSDDGVDLYVLDACTGASQEHCVGDRKISGHLDYVAPADGTYYLVVDATTPSAGRYVLQVDRHGGYTCQPGEVRCDASTNQASVCAADGSVWTDFYQCANGCTSNGCAPPPTPNDTCQQAYVIDGPTLIADSFRRFNDDYASLQCGSNFYAQGADAVYQVDLNAGEVLLAELHTEVGSTNTKARPQLYVSTDCADIEGSCAAGGTVLDPWRGSLGYRAPSDQTVYLVADSDKYSLSDFWLSVDILASEECTPGQAQCVDAQTSRVCQSYGAWTRHTCENGCTNGRCDAPWNDTCANGQPIMRDGTYYDFDVQLDDYTNSADAGAATNAHCNKFRTPGPDAVYEIDARAGDVVDAYWRGDDRAALWLTDDCTAPADHCIAAERYQAHLHQVIPADGVYWLYVDELSNANEDPGMLHVAVLPKVCTPGESTCSATTGLLTYCSADGTRWETYACTGTCSNVGGAHCAQPRGERCVDPIDATGGGSFSIDLSEFDNSLSPTSSCGGLVGASGGDVIFRVDLSAGQTVQASIAPPPSAETTVYILDTCPPLGSSPTCLANATAASYGAPPSATFQASSDQTVYVVVDSGSDYDASDPPTAVDISIQ